MHRTTINLSDRDLEVIEWLKNYTLKEQGVKLTTTQIIVKALYNEKWSFENYEYSEPLKLTK